MYSTSGGTLFYLRQPCLTNFPPPLTHATATARAQASSHHASQVYSQPAALLSSRKVATAPCAALAPATDMRQAPLAVPLVALVLPLVDLTIGPGMLASSVHLVALALALVKFTV